MSEVGRATQTEDVDEGGMGRSDVAEVAGVRRVGTVLEHTANQAQVEPSVIILTEDLGRTDRPLPREERGIDYQKGGQTSGAYYCHYTVQCAPCEQNGARYDEAES